MKTPAHLRVSTLQENLACQRLAILEYAHRYDLWTDDFLEAPRLDKPRTLAAASRRCWEPCSRGVGQIIIRRGKRLASGNRDGY